jgi:hypothetical protein
MNRAPIGHAATVILRRIHELARITVADRKKPILVIEEIRSTDWASLTFQGQRHVFELRLDGGVPPVATALASLAAELPEADVPISGHFVAEIAVTPGEVVPARGSAAPGQVSQSLRVEALVLRD